jgi:hypothetical protein
MRIFRRKKELTDDEYVEKLKRQMRQMRVSRKVAVFTCAVLGICLVAVCVLGTILANRFFDSMKAPSFFEHGFRVGLAIGIFAGWFFMMLVGQFAIHFWMAFGPNFFRLHRLLFKYHDLAKVAPGHDTNRIA